MAKKVFVVISMDEASVDILGAFGTESKAASLVKSENAEIDKERDPDNPYDGGTMRTVWMQELEVK